MNNSAISNISTLGLILKSGNMVYGFDSVKEEIEKKNPKLAGVILASDLSAKSKKETEYARDKFLPRLELVTVAWDMEQIGKVIGKKTGIIAVLDQGLWKSLLR